MAGQQPFYGGAAQQPFNMAPLPPPPPPQMYGNAMASQPAMRGVPPGSYHFAEPAPMTAPPAQQQQQHQQQQQQQQQHQQQMQGQHRGYQLPVPGHEGY
jgi:hypothetical protein